MDATGGHCVRCLLQLALTLDEAVRRAVENNPDLAIVRLGTEVEAARVGESRGAFAPVFSTTTRFALTQPAALLGRQGRRTCSQHRS